MSAQLQVTGEAKIRDIQGPVVANDGVITALDGAANQYVRGDGTLASFPTSGGGGSSVSYYLNGSVNQGTFGGSTYYQMSKDAITGAGTNFSTSSNGLLAQFITDANDPDVVSIPSGNWNVEFFMGVSASSGSLASFYVEIYKYDGSTFTLLATNVATPEQLTNTTTTDAYFTSVAMPLSAMALTDRLAVRIYANVASKTVTLYTEDNRLCQVVTTFSKGILSINNLTDQSQNLTTGTSGTNFAIVSSGDTHTFNLPVASATNTGKLSSTDWSTFNNKVPYTGATGSVDLGTYGLTTSQLSVSVPTGSSASNLFYVNNVLKGSITSDSTYFQFDSKVAGGFVFNNSAAQNILILQDNKAAVFYGSIINYGFTNTTALGLTGSGGATQLTSNATSNKSIIVPNENGTLALTSDLTAYVPYTGATSNVTLGTNTLTASTLIVDQGTTGTTLRFKQYASATYNTNGYTDIYAVNNNIVGFALNQGSGNFKGFSFLVNNVTLNENRSLYIPDASGTIALTSNLSSYLPLTGGNITGNLTIGSPASALAQFHIYNSSAAASMLVQTNSSTDYAEIAARNYNQTSTCYYRQYSSSASGTDFGASRANLAALFSNYASNFAIGTQNGGDLILGTANTERLRIASTGAATFSSSVTAGGRVLASGGSTNAFSGSNNSASEATLYINNANASGYGVYSAGGINYFAGNVGIGTTNPQLITANRTTVDISGVSNSLLVFSLGTTFIGYIYNNGSGMDYVSTGSAGFSAAGNVTLSAGNAERMRITSSGNTLIGTTTDNGNKLQVGGGATFSSSVVSGSSFLVVNTASSTIGVGSYTSLVNSGNSYQILQQLNAGYNLDFWSYRGSWTNVSRIDGASGTYTALSDVNKKKDFEESKVGLDAILNLKPTLYRMKEEGDDVEKHLGFIAQEVKEFIPQAYLEQDGFIGLNDRPIIAVLVKATQELKSEKDAEIAELRAQIEELKQLINNK